MILSRIYPIFLSGSFISNNNDNINRMEKYSRKKELDKQRTAWRKTHRTLNGRIILYSEKPPEHINARGSKIYNWFWKKILLETESQNIPAIITAIRNRIKTEKDTKNIRLYRTMIGMAEDCYQLKQLEDIKDYDTELQLGTKPVYNSEEGIIYRKGKIFTTDYDEDEDNIIMRDIEGIIVDILSAEEHLEKVPRNIVRNNIYKNWNYMEESGFANI